MLLIINIVAIALTLFIEQEITHYENIIHIILNFENILCKIKTL